MSPSQVIDWMYQITSNNYLWSGSIVNKEAINSSLAPVEYFEQLRYRGQFSTGIAFIDYGDRFSRIQQRTNNPARSRSLNSQTTTDFGLKLRYFVSGIHYNECHVLYTYKGSSAHNSGIQRGDIFNKINGKDISTLSQNAVLTALNASEVTLGFISPQVKTVKLHSTNYTVNPIVLDSIYNDRVAYLHYSSFLAGSGNSNNIALIRFFNRAKERGVEDIVLDLRYNGGGDLSVAQLLGSLLARREMLGNIMIYKESNKTMGQSSQFEPMRFLNTPEVINSNLNPRKIVVLTSDLTASASELMIHALRPYFGDNLTVVGMTTIGKNLGGIEYTSTRHNWEFYLMTFRIYNCDKVSNYEGGIIPTYNTTEFTSMEYKVAPLGDRQHDPLLIKAIEVLGKTTVGVSTTQSSRSITAPQDYIDIPCLPLVDKRIQIDL